MKKQVLTAVAGLVLTASAAVAGAQLVVRIGPPPERPREEVPPPPPEHRDWAWHNGYHRWDGHGYVWVPGHYEQPPYRHAHWVEGHWGPGRGGYVWHEGHWAR
jgi:hypothetical protein